MFFPGRCGRVSEPSVPLSNVFRIITLPAEFTLLGPCTFHREAGLRGERTGPGLCSRVAVEARSLNPRPQGKPLHSRGLLPTPALSQLLSSFLHGSPCPGQAHRGHACPSPITSPPSKPMPVPPPLRFICCSVCDSPPLLFKAAYFIHHRQQFIFPGESFAWSH